MQHSKNKTEMGEFENNIREDWYNGFKKWNSGMIWKLKKFDSLNETY